MIESLDNHIGMAHEDDSGINSNSASPNEASYPGGGLQAIRESRETLTVQKGGEMRVVEAKMPSPRQLRFGAADNYNSSTTLNKHLEDLMKTLIDTVDDPDEPVPPEYKDNVIAPIVFCSVLILR